MGKQIEVMFSVPVYYLVDVDTGEVVDAYADDELEYREKFCDTKGQAVDPQDPDAKRALEIADSAPWHVTTGIYPNSRR